MFLSRIEIGPRAAEHDAFWRDVAHPYGAHQALWKLFGRGPDQKRDFLYRADERSPRPGFLVLSAAAPESDDHGLWSVETKAFAPALRVGQRLGFRLRASPVVRRGEGDGEARRTRRHDVVMDLRKKLARQSRPTWAGPDLVRDAGIVWLESQAARAGFRIPKLERDEIREDGLLEESTPELAVRVDGYRQHRILRRGERPITFSTLDFEGVLEVADPAAFLGRVAQGFGPQKAFGCGLMLLRRA